MSSKEHEHAHHHPHGGDHAHESGSKDESCCHGPGYASPLQAMKGPKEKLLYIPCIMTNGRADYLVTVDSDPASPTYSQVINRLPVSDIGDELHHTGWNACSSCYSDDSKKRKYLIAVGLKSGNLYAIDTSEEKAPKLHKVVSGKEIREKTKLTWPHTVHCLGSGDIMVSCMGDQDGNGSGGFLLLDQNFNIKGRWENGNGTPFGYDFWYQPRHNIMVSSGWGDPNSFSKGFNPAEVPTKYGKHLYFWDWKERKLIKSVDLGNEGLIPLEVRFMHNPDQAHGFVAAALSSTVIHFFKDSTGEWKTETVIAVPNMQVEGWVLPEVPSLITDILISLDDKYVYFSNWLQGDIRQYDISDPHKPKLVGQVYLGGVVRSDGTVKLKNNAKAPDIPVVKGKELRGAPQMIQLSLDGKRLYVTTSLFSPWDKQFYPTMAQKGSQLLQVDVDTEKGGLTLNKNFIVDFADEPFGPSLAHEIRYPGGDCTSDIWP